VIGDRVNTGSRFSFHPGGQLIGFQVSRPPALDVGVHLRRPKAKEEMHRPLGPLPADHSARHDHRHMAITSATPNGPSGAATPTATHRRRQRNRAAPVFDGRHPTRRAGLSRISVQAANAMHQQLPLHREISRETGRGCAYPRPPLPGRTPRASSDCFRNWHEPADLRCPRHGRHRG
jgi:hypothetical protein